MGATRSLSLVRGAEVVGVDFSPEAVKVATQRAQTAGLAATLTFVLASVTDAPSRLLGTFDIVYTSWGVLVWLPDLDQWAATVASLLRPGGFLYMAETHPYAEALLDGVDWTYGGAVAHFNESQGDYTDADAVFAHPQAWEWSHGLGEIVTALAGAGLRLNFLHERSVTPWHLNAADRLRQRDDGLWEQQGSSLPLSFSLKATKPAATERGTSSDRS